MTKSKNLKNLNLQSNQPTKRLRALITGASAGIGQELAREFARNGIDLVLVARRAAALEQLANEIHSKSQLDVKIIAKDLKEPGAARDIYEQLEQENIKIDFLVNNAGVGVYGDFIDSDLQATTDMLHLNMIVLTELTHYFAKDMANRGQGSILNIASTAAFQPGPHMAGYYASKAFVLSFSEALAFELEPKGVKVSALCPGPTISEFQQVAKMEASRMVRNTGLMMSAKEVAEIGFHGLISGRKIVIPGIANKFGACSVRFLPRQLVTRVSAFVAANGAGKV